eukprot:4511113-Pleurochrysis_carterae.AAC.1
MAVATAPLRSIQHRTCVHVSSRKRSDVPAARAIPIPVTSTLRSLLDSLRSLLDSLSLRTSFIFMPPQGILKKRVRSTLQGAPIHAAESNPYLKHRTGTRFS